MPLVYLAARYSRRNELVAYRGALASRGYDCTSRWLNGNHQVSDDGLSAEAKESERIRFANEDRADLLSAEVVISFTESPRSANSRGGRHVEFGMAIAHALRCVVVGPRENVFHCLPEVEWHADWSSFSKAWDLPDVTLGGKLFAVATRSDP